MPKRIPHPEADATLASLFEHIDEVNAVQKAYGDVVVQHVCDSSPGLSFQTFKKWVYRDLRWREIQEKEFERRGFGKRRPVPHPLSTECGMPHELQPMSKEETMKAVELMHINKCIGEHCDFITGESNFGTSCGVAQRLPQPVLVQG
mmetsp:Transcript_2571/g.5435  ORF Transcript_2571/g.5435 Transcript_2571/m.5435 type:complete len:147 (-) Transcript_2571:505-945(-)